MANPHQVRLAAAEHVGEGRQGLAAARGHRQAVRAEVVDLARRSKAVVAPIDEQAHTAGTDQRQVRQAVAAQVGEQRPGMEELTREGGKRDEALPAFVTVARKEAGHARLGAHGIEDAVAGDVHQGCGAHLATGYAQ
ncbi:Uncharacterised protein [Burkholderia pseudomallei]|nr:Uncharacterised protein [Burkholderia pseudomallei]